MQLERTFESLLLMGLDFGLISNELYQSLKDTCKGEYYQIDPSNALCLRYMQTLNQLLSDLVFDHTLEKKCPFASPEPSKNFDGRISAIDTFNLKTEELKVQEPIPIKCRIDGYWLAYCWSNDKSVQEALHVHKGSIVEWIRCNRGLPYTTSVGDVVPYHANISMKGYRSLVYSGDHDLLVPHLATQAWIKSLNYHIIDDWRQWIVGGQVAGYTRTYANKMTFATVKGGGHIAQEYNPEECLAMLQRWISNEAL